MKKMLTASALPLLLALAAACGPEPTDESVSAAPEPAVDAELDFPMVDTTSQGLCANWNQSGTFALTKISESRTNCLAATPTLWSMFSPLSPMGGIPATTNDTEAKDLAQSFRLIALTGDTGCSAGNLSSSSCSAYALGGCVLGGVPFLLSTVTFNTTSIFTVRIQKNITPSASGTGTCSRDLKFQATRTGP